MNKKILMLILFVPFMLSACARLEVESFSTQENTQTQLANIATSNAAIATNIDEFIALEAVNLLSEKDKASAASSQFYSLQFGRPGVARGWQGETGANGKITVGPYVRVNDLVCRDFEHIVIVGDKKYIKNGTACRENNGSWAVVLG